MNKLLIAALVLAFAGSALAEGSGTPATQAPSKTDAKKVATAKKAPKIISVKEKLAMEKAKKSAGKPVAPSAKPAGATETKPAK
jgi:phage-related minor tail protein